MYKWINCTRSQKKITNIYFFLTSKQVAKLEIHNFLEHTKFSHHLHEPIAWLLDFQTTRQRYPKHQEKGKKRNC